MLVSSKDMLVKARKEGYAVLAINTQGGHYDIIRAAVVAAEEKKAPIILAHYTSTGAYSGHEWFVRNSEFLANQVKVPVAIHLDHGEGFNACMEALRLGFTSIMYDGSAQPLEENIRSTNEIIRIAHAFEVPVEAEIGVLQRLDDFDNGLSFEDNIVSLNTVLYFLEHCKPDSLAIGIGNAHGYYKATPQLRMDILEEVTKVSDIPLVLHGCTGMENRQIQEAISKGVAKINYGTMIRTRYVEYLREALTSDIHGNHAWKISKMASERLQKDIEVLIDVSGSTGRAK